MNLQNNFLKIERSEYKKIIKSYSHKQIKKQSVYIPFQKNKQYNVSVLRNCHYIAYVVDTMRMGKADKSAITL